MKQTLLFCLLLSTIGLNAQLVNEDFDSYTIGTFNDTQWNPMEWTGWFGGPSTVTIDSTFARSAPNSMLINGSNDDIVALLGTLDEGTYEVTFYQYIPNGFGGYFNFQHNYTSTVGDWAFQIYFGDSTVNLARIITNTMTTTFTPIFDQWIENKFEFNFDNDEAKYYYDGNLVHTWVISTNAGGGPPGLNQINGINFYGTCDGTNCVTKAYYDDISVVQTALPLQHDAKIVKMFEPLPYTQIPDSLITPMSFAAEVTNLGQMPITNIQVTFNVLDGNNNIVHSDISNTLPFLAANALGTVNGSGSYLPPNQSDVYTVTCDVTISEIDDNPQNNTDTLLFEVTITDSIYAKDDGNYNDGLGANGLTAMIGQNFEFVESVLVHSVNLAYNEGLAGDQIRLIIYKTDSITKMPMEDIYTSPNYTLPINGAGLGFEQFRTFYIPNSIRLNAGLYTFAIEQMTTNSIGIATSTAIFRPETTLTSTNGGASWGFLENFGFKLALHIRPNVSLAPQIPINTRPIQNVEILELMPNPTPGLFVINIELSQKQAVQIDVFNIEGKLIQTIWKEEITMLQQSIDLTNEINGLYLVRFKIGNEIVTKRILVNRK